MHLGEVLKTVPTIGFNVESVKHGKVKFTIWDVGGQDRMRCLWKHYTEDTDGLIYFVDSVDKERMDVARDEFHKIVGDINKHCPIVVVANKQDLAGSLSGTEVGNKLEIHRFEADREVHVQETSILKGEGVVEVMNVLETFIRKPRRKT